MQSLRRTPGAIQQRDIVLNVAAGALWPMCQCWSGYRYVAISGPRASSGVTAIRGHTQPGSPPSARCGVRCQVVTIARQRQETIHTWAENTDTIVLPSFLAKTPNTNTTLTQAGDLTQDWLKRRESVEMLAWRLFFSAHFIVGTYLVFTAGNKGQWCQ